MRSNFDVWQAFIFPSFLFPCRAFSAPTLLYRSFLIPTWYSQCLLAVVGAWHISYCHAHFPCHFLLFFFFSARSRAHLSYATFGDPCERRLCFPIFLKMFLYSSLFSFLPLRPGFISPVAGVFPLSFLFAVLLLLFFVPCSAFFFFMSWSAVFFLVSLRFFRLFPLSHVLHRDSFSGPASLSPWNLLT